jgi:hypothetical protein
MHRGVDDGEGAMYLRIFHGQKSVGVQRGKLSRLSKRSGAQGS